MKKQKISKERLRMIDSAIAYLRFKGYHEIQAPHVSFKPARAVFRKASEPGFAPDMIAEKDFGSYIFEIVDNPETFNWDENLEKWQLFDEYTKRKKGRFYLIAYSDTIDIVSERVEKMDIDPGYIKIRR